MVVSPFILASSDPVSHIIDKYLFQSADGLWLWSANASNLVLSGLILIVGGLYVSKRIGTGPESDGNDRWVTKSRFAHSIEVICVWLRDEMVRPLLKDRTDRMMPFLWTLFFFILVNNLLGLVPLVDLQHIVMSLVTGKDMSEFHTAAVGGTATQNLWVTGALALIAGVVLNIAAIKRLGFLGYLHHQTAGAPWYVWIIVFPIEVFGNILIKPVALAIRLFANMTAGHILLAVLIGFVAQVWGKGMLIQGPVTVMAVAGAIAIFFLELFVAFLQAFIFMFLTAVFISLLDHHDEEHAHGDVAAAH